MRKSEDFKQSCWWLPTWHDTSDRKSIKHTERRDGHRHTRYWCVINWHTVGLGKQCSWMKWLQIIVVLGGISYDRKRLDQCCLFSDGDYKINGVPFWGLNSLQLSSISEQFWKLYFFCTASLSNYHSTILSTGRWFAENRDWCSTFLLASVSDVK